MHVYDHRLRDLEGITFCEEELEERARVFGVGVGMVIAGRESWGVPW